MEHVPLESILVPLTAVLGLSLVVERVLEVAKNILEKLLVSREGRSIPKLKDADRLINGLEQKYERGKNAEKLEKEGEKVAAERMKLKAELEKETDPEKKKEIRTKLLELEKGKELDEQVPLSKVFVEPATEADDGSTLRIFILQLLGFAVGIILAHYSGVQLFNSFLKTLGQGLIISEWMDYLFTGLLIGGGSGPMHVLVSFVTDRKIILSETESKPEDLEQPTKEEQISAPAIDTSEKNELQDWIDIDYKGGVDRDTLEDTHLRKKDPDLIVYHHTAMNSKSTFQDVVRVIKDKKWLTGYNCVIQYDGLIHPFCRWDRFGNHAIGYNARSLGISFNGNFETDPKVPFSNPDGRMGPSRPSEAQVKAGARVVALWTFIYPVPVDFENSIIPHNKISTKTCPGNSFPYGEFQKWVEYFRTEWGKSEAIKQRIEAFKLKPYLYV